MSLGRLRSAVHLFLRGKDAIRVASVVGTEDSRHPVESSWFQEAGRQINARGIFVGCPLEAFEYSSRDPLCLALMEGLTPDSTVLEVGCGCLRVGYWFVRYLNAGKYFALEPNQRMLEAGRELILRQMEAEKRPVFSLGDDFDFEVFATGFDFVIVFSIWTHASKAQIARMLDQFGSTARPRGKFIASWFPASSDRPDYQGTSWVGRSHQSDRPGIVGHSIDWIREAVSARGLRLRIVEGFTTLNQDWLIISK